MKISELLDINRIDALIEAAPESVEILETIGYLAAEISKLRGKLNELERERDEAREEIEMLGIRYAAAEMHHETNMQEVTEQRDRLAEALEYILGIGLTQKTKAKAEKALQTTQSNE